MKTRNNTQNLQQTIRFFETLLRASADGIVITDAAKNIVFVNETFCKFFSCNRQDVIETNLFIWLSKLGNNAHNVWKEMETRIKEYGIAKDVEFAMMNGEMIRYFSVNSSLLEKIDIEEQGLIISLWRDDTERKIVDMALKRAHDELELRVKERTAQLTNKNLELEREIHERKRVEEALQAEKDNLVRIFEAMSDGVYIVDRKYDIHYVNPVLQKDFGLYEGRKCYEYFHDRDQSCPWCKNEEVFAGKTVRWEWYSPKNDKTYDLIDTPILNSDGTIYKLELFRDITERKQMEKAMSASLDEKTILLNEVHHRVKNNLQIVSSLLSLQAMRTKNKEALDTLRETGNRVFTMAQLHETLYRSGNMAKVNFSGYIDNICFHVIRSYGADAANISFEQHLANIDFDIDQAVPCGLIINELVSNALKHAFPKGQKGRIIVELRSLPDDIAMIKVADDGIGLPPELDISKSETLGLKLVSMLTEKLKGSVEIIRDKGTAFHITFKTKKD